MHSISTRSERVTFGVPAYRAAEFIAETLRSLLAQEHPHFRVVVAVDSHDDRTADVCRGLEDPRIEVVEHAETKGWVGNLNWLYAGCETEFFNYVGHDDLLHRAYLRLMLEEADRRPDAVAVYPVLQWFGSYSHQEVHPLPGTRLERQKWQLAFRRWAPFHGLVRREPLALAAPLRTAPFGSVLEDVDFSSRLALEGPLALVPLPLYGKRRRRGSASEKFSTWDPTTRRAAWISAMERLLDTALRAAENGGDRRDLLLLAARSLVRRHPLAWSFFAIDALTPEARVSMATEFLVNFAEARRLQLDEELGVNWRDVVREL
jgi:glycosyltransferase involved in cell wall biosynthesis